MSMIIHKTNYGIQAQSCRVYPENWEGEDWLPVPLELEQLAAQHAPYCTLVLDNNGNLTGIEPTERPPEPTPPPSMEQRTAALEDAMLAMMGGGPIE